MYIQSQTSKCKPHIFVTIVKLIAFIKVFTSTGNQEELLAPLDTNRLVARKETVMFSGNHIFIASATGGPAVTS